MYYDLNIPWTANANQAELRRTLTFLRELDYNIIALNHTLSKVPADASSPIPSPLPFPVPPKLHILTRCTLIISDPAQNFRLSTLAQHYDILALRPTTEKALQQATQTLDCDLISLDLSQRFPFHFKHKTLSNALQRGVRFEICYGAGVGEDVAGGGQAATARRNLITNAVGLIRATRGRGLVVSSEAKRALGLRAPADVVNLAAVWGLGQERGLEAVSREARAVVVQAESKRRGWRGAIYVVDGGMKPEGVVVDRSKGKGKGKGKAQGKDGGGVEKAAKDGEGLKRKAEDGEEGAPISKREAKRRAKAARKVEMGEAAEIEKDVQANMKALVNAQSMS